MTCRNTTAKRIRTESHGELLSFAPLTGLSFGRGRVLWNGRPGRQRRPLRGQQCLSYEAGVLHTYPSIDLDLIDPARLPIIPEITAITLAELHQGVAMAKDAGARAARMEKSEAAVTDFESLPFDGDAAARYGNLVALTVAANRDPRPRRMDLMIAAVASTRGLPLYTRNDTDFKGLESIVTVVAV
ncbi:type II toxin-antitoxin system VapC family toxin [Nonomuraea sp. NPDC059194]|uniref:type II toxin-antitoxin system VapC family toxin n=1 Tax=Nonomuraea sp. NPDC059194 TaxID=3346764 RepID=UPI0036B6D337